MGRVPANDIVRGRPLMRDATCFYCPYCGRSFVRGGRGEGFVKSGANNHARTCREVLLYLKGYVLCGDGAAELTPADEKATHRRLRAHIANRRREGAEVGSLMDAALEEYDAKRAIGWIP